jgi:regulator of RNase E activity RraA
MTVKELVEGFRNVATASVADAVDMIVGKRGYMDYSIKPRINGKKVVGPAVTILEGSTEEVLPPTHALDAIDESPEGSVIVIGINGEPNVAVWGGLMTAGAVVNGLAGAILDGGVRDIIEIRRDYDFQIFSRSVSPATTLGRFKTLSSNEPVECGGIQVNPGDLIVAVPKEHVHAVLEKAIEIEVREAEQAKLVRETKSLRKGLEKYKRI